MNVIKLRVRDGQHNIVAFETYDIRFGWRHNIQLKAIKRIIIEQNTVVAPYISGVFDDAGYSLTNLFRDLFTGAHNDAGEDIYENDVFRDKEPYPATSDYPYYAIKYSPSQGKFLAHELTGLKKVFELTKVKYCSLAGVLNEKNEIILNK